MAKHSDPATRAVYEAAARFREQCLESDGSLFLPNTAVWSYEVAADLHRRFVEAPDTTGDTFETKLERQLKDAPTATISLAAEVLFVHFLIAADIGGARKRRLINRVLSWSPDHVEVPAELAGALDHGLAKTGVAFNTYRPNQLWLLVELVLAWKQLPESERAQDLHDPWAFKAFLGTLPIISSHAQFNAVLHLVHPESFEPIVSRDHKNKIATAFAQHSPAEADTDRRLLAIRQSLSERLGSGFSFYQPEVRNEWDPESTQDPDDPEVAPSTGPLSGLFDEFMTRWVEAVREPLKGHPIQATMGRLRDAIRDVAARHSVELKVDASVGSGNWAQVPWIALLHRQETTSTQRGVYPVYLFRADGSGVYLTLAQGVTEANQTLGRAKAREELKARARRTRDSIERALPSFEFDLAAELRGATELAHDYESSVIAHRFYDVDELPDDEELKADLAELLQAYAAFVEGRARQPRSWLFTGLTLDGVGQSLSTSSELSLRAGPHVAEMAVEDDVFLWIGGMESGIRAAGRLVEVPQTGQRPGADPVLIVEPADGVRCVVRVEAAFPGDPIPASVLRGVELEIPWAADPPAAAYLVRPETAGRLRELVLSRVALLVGAVRDADADAAQLRTRVKPVGRAAIWWSFSLSEDSERALRNHPFVYFYQGLPSQSLVVRCHILDWSTKSGASGMVCPWPEYVPPELRGRLSAGPTKSETFKTWFLVDRVESVEPALGLLELERLDGQPMNPSGLVGGFQLWRRRQSAPAPTLADLSSETHLSVERLTELQSLVALHGQTQIVFEGPPGSGKTYIADKFARFLTGNPLRGPTDGRILTVQFHQSYGYEDFVQGIRPETDSATGLLRYEVRPGVFKELCDRAAADENRTYVVVIDEINRGNLSRIFGELLLVLEYRDRSVQLAYSPPGTDPFEVPRNVVVLRTMNTTDRSLTQIDYALRRRFYFYGLAPVEGDTAPVLEGWLTHQSMSTDARTLVLDLFLRLNRKLRDELGEHFMIGHSYFMKAGIEKTEFQEQIWRYAVMPLLSEYFYNRPDLKSLLAGFTRQALLAEGASLSE